MFTVPTITAAKVVKATRVYDFDGGPTGNESQFFTGSSLGFGLATELTY